VGEGDHILPVQLLRLKGVGFVGLLRLQRGQGHPAAGDGRLSGGVEHIAAHRTDVQGGPQKICPPVPVDDLLPGEKLRNGDVQGSGQGLQKREIREAPAGLPF